MSTRMQSGLLLSAFCLGLSLLVTPAAARVHETGDHNFSQPEELTAKEMLGMKPGCAGPAPTAPPEMSPEKHAMIHQAMEKAHAADQKLIDQAHKLHEDLVKLVEAEKFNKAAYVKKSKALAKVMDQLSVSQATTMAEVMTKLTPEERERFLKHHMTMHQMMMAHKGVKNGNSVHPWHGKHHESDTMEGHDTPMEMPEAGMAK